MQNATAILIFTRTAGEEASSKHFSSAGHRVNTLIAASLIRHAEATVRATGLPYFVVYSDHQSGANFGERLGNAVNCVFDKGFSKVIAIGNDSPDISTSLLLESAEQLENSDIVVGPTKDGGLYLIGLHKSAFRLEVFASWNWKTTVLVDSILKDSDRLGSIIAILDTLTDIDKSADLVVWLKGYSAPFDLAAYIEKLIRKAEIGFAAIKEQLLLCMFYREHGFRAPTL